MMNECRHTTRDGRRCLLKQGHKGKHKYPAKGITFPKAAGTSGVTSLPWHKR